MIDIEHADGAMEICGSGPQGALRRVGERDFHAAAFRLIELKGQAHLGVNAAFERRGISRRIRLSGDELLMPVQCLLRLLRSAQPKQRLAEKKIRGRIIRSELNDLGELIGGLLIMLQLHVRAPELEADGIHLGVDVLGLLQKLDGLLELPQAQVRAPAYVIRRPGIGIQAQHLLREIEGVFALAREQTGIGEIQQRIGLGRLKRNRLLKGFDGVGRCALFVITLAHVHQPGESVGAGKWQRLRAGEKIVE